MVAYLTGVVANTETALNVLQHTGLERGDGALPSFQVVLT